MFKQSLYLTSALLILALASLFSTVASADEFGCINPTTYGSRPIYMINPGPIGSCTECTQDYDADLVEYLAFLAEHNITAKAPGVIGDMFPDCQDGIAHGDIVRQYYSGFGAGAGRIHMGHNGMAELITDMIAYANGNGHVGNLSVSDGYHVNPERVAAFRAAYDAGLLLVGVAPAFGVAREQNQLGDRIIQIYKYNQIGPMEDDGDAKAATNLSGLYFSAYWNNESNYNVLAKPGSALAQGQDNPAYDFEVGGFTDSSSFGSPLAAGIMTPIMAIVKERGLTGGDLVGQTIDYIVSGSDHPDDSFSFQSDVLTSYAPWSSTWKYGMFNPWKALLYASGYGRIHSMDNELYGVVNPVTTFNDHFELRGDLQVDYDQHLHIGSMASVTIKTSVPEGYNYGNEANLHEVRVDGELTLAGDMSASLIIGSTGVVTVEETGSLTIGEGQTLIIEDGGVLDFKGTIVVAGQLQNNGGILILNSDLNITETGSFIASEGSLILVGDTDLMAAGDDAGEIEIDCLGHLALEGLPDNPVIVRSANPGSDSWAGLSLNSVHPDNSILFNVEISDAEIGLDLSGDGVISLEAINFFGNQFGLKITGRDDDEVIDCTFTGGNIAILLEDSHTRVIECVMQDNAVGVHCDAGAHLTLRSSMVSNNLVGIRIPPSAMAPDLGTELEPGQNQFLVRGKRQNHIVAFDLSRNIVAKYNWWGTTSDRELLARIVMPMSLRKIVFLPKLMSPPFDIGNGLNGVTDTNDSDLPMDLVSKAQIAFRTSQFDRFETGVKLSFFLPKDGMVELAVFDLRGRKVRSLASHNMSMGEHAITWDGRNANGSRLPNGVYLVRLASNQQATTTKVMMVK